MHKLKLLNVIALFATGFATFLFSGLCHSAPALKTEMPKDRYLQKIKIELQRSLCTEASLLQCFRVAKSDCMQSIGANFGLCAKTLKISETVSLTGEDLLIAESLGKCVSEKFGAKFQTKFIEGSECATRK